MVDLDGLGIWNIKVEMIGCRKSGDVWVSACRNEEVVGEA